MVLQDEASVSQTFSECSGGSGGQHRHMQGYPLVLPSLGTERVSSVFLRQETQWNAIGVLQSRKTFLSFFEPILASAVWEDSIVPAKYAMQYMAWIFSICNSESLSRYWNSGVSFFFVSVSTNLLIMYKCSYVSILNVCWINILFLFSLPKKESNGRFCKPLGGPTKQKLSPSHSDL